MRIDYLFDSLRLVNKREVPVLNRHQQTSGQSLDGVSLFTVRNVQTWLPAPPSYDSFSNHPTPMMCGTPAPAMVTDDVQQITEPIRAFFENNDSI
jgi:hypothetical protein